MWNQDVLPDGTTQFTVAIRLGNLGQADRLLTGNATDWKNDTHLVATGLLLRMKANMGQSGLRRSAWRRDCESTRRNFRPNSSSTAAMNMSNPQPSRTCFERAFLRSVRSPLLINAHTIAPATSTHSCGSSNTPVSRAKSLWPVMNFIAHIKWILGLFGCFLVAQFFAGFDRVGLCLKCDSFRPDGQSFAVHLCSTNAQRDSRSICTAAATDDRQTADCASNQCQTRSLPNTADVLRENELLLSFDMLLTTTMPQPRRN